MDVSGAVELYVNRAASEIAPVRITGNYGSEIVRRQIAFRPRPAKQGLHDPALRQQIERAAAMYNASRSRTHDLSFIAFQQVPWHHHARLAVERSQLIVRSPFLDTELVALLYRSPEARATDSAALLDLMHGRSRRLAELPTDRGLSHPAATLVSSLRRVIQSFTVRTEYAYDYGMPQWLNRVDEALRPLRLHRLFLGRHKFYHFRLWYRHQLADHIQAVLLDRRTLERSCFEAAALARMVRNHVSGRGNHTLEIHRALTHELTLRTLIDRWSGMGADTA
jgi:asparagine synthase (glutamine-hydrolysing)